MSRLQKIRDDLASKQSGKIGYIVAWALGVPIPILLLVYMLRGCS